MKSKFYQLPFSLSLLVSLSACSLGAQPTPTPDVQATVQAAVDTAVKTKLPAPADTPTPDLQATVNAAVQATAQAGQGSVAVVVQATVVSMPTPSPLPAAGDAYYYSLSQEELAALVDESVDAAMTASAQTTAVTTQATSDGSVSDGDVQTVQVYVSLSEQTVANAQALITAYQDIYGDYASDYLVILNEIEQDLAAIAQSTAEIASILDQGAQAATQAIQQLNSAAQTTQVKAAEAQAQAQSRQQKFQSDMQKRLEELINIKPIQVATDPQGAVQETFQYLDSLKQALNGKKINSADLKQIIQLGVNASAGLKTQGGPQLQRFANGIDNLNQQVVRGEFPQAKRDLAKFDSDFTSLDKRPGRK